MTTLVTGATGLLGNNVVRALLARGDAVRVLARESSDPRPLADLDIEIVRGDIRDLDAVRRACRGADIMVHAAAWVHLGWTGADLARETNVEGTRCVAQAALEHGLRMIHVSTMNALGLGSRQQPADEQLPPGGQVPCPYVLTKREGERVVQQLAAERLDVVIVNPGLMFGPWDWKPSSGRILLELASHFVPVAPRGGSSVCDVRDVADGILAAIDKGQTHRNYVLAGHNMLYFDLFRMVAEVTGRPRPWFRAGAGPFGLWLVGKFGDALSRLTGKEPDFNSAAIGLSGQFHFYSSQRAADELGYRYRSVLESITDSWNWLKEYGYSPA